MQCSPVHVRHMEHAAQRRHLLRKKLLPLSVRMIIGISVQAKESEQAGERLQYIVDKKDVKERVGELLKIQDLSKYVL